MKNIIKKLSVIIILISIILLYGCSNNNASDLHLIIETDLYSFKLSDKWGGYYNYEKIYDSEKDVLKLEINMNSKNEEKKAFLFCVELLPTKYAAEIVASIENTMVNPIGILTTDNGSSYFVSSYQASEATCTDEELEKYIELAEDIDNCLVTFKPKYEEQFQLWNENLFNQIKSSIETAPYVPINQKIIGESFEAYKRRTGSYCYDISNNKISDSFLLNQIEGLSYYQNENGMIVVEGDRIVAVSYFPNINAGVGVSVRDFINALQLTDLFYVTPEVISVDNEAVSLSIWLTDNGYIGIKSVGKTDPQSIYENTVLLFVAFESKNLCSVCN